MKSFLTLLSVFLAFSALGQSRIKDLPLMTSYTTNTSFPVDDATFGVRRLTFSGLVTVLEALGIEGGGQTDISGKMDITNGVSQGQTLLGSSTASSLTATNLTVTTLNSVISSAELGYLDGTDENIHDQFLTKQDVITGAATTIDTEDLTASRALVSDVNGKVAASSVTAEQLGYIGTSRSDIQDQIDALSGATSGGTNSFVKLATMATLATIAADTDPNAHPDVVFLVEYWSGTGKGGGRWYKDTSSTAGTNGAVVAINGGGRYLPVWDNYEVDVTRFGAKGDGSTTDSGFFTQAATMQTNNPALWTYFPGYTYRCTPDWPAPEGFKGKFHPNTRIEPTIFPSTMVDPLNNTFGVFVLTNNCILECNGGGFNGRRYELVNTNTDFAMIKVAFCSNTIVRNALFENYPALGVLTRYATNAVFENCRSTTGAGGSQFYTGHNLLLDRWTADGLVMDTTEALGIMNCVGGIGTRILNPVFQNIYAGTNANYASTAMNMFGETSLSIINPQFRPMAAGSKRPVIALVIDGGDYVSIIGGSIYGWNYGNCTGIELHACGWLLVDGVRIDSQYYAPGDGSGQAGSAGILISPGDGIWTIDQQGDTLPRWISRAIGWQQRSQSTLHDAVIRNVSVSGYYDGALVKGGVRIDFDNCHFDGNQYGVVQREDNDQPWTDWSQTSKFHTPTQIRYLDCTFNYNLYNGFRYDGGQECEWINCQFNNNDQSATGEEGFVTEPNASGAFTSTGSQTVGNVSGRTSGADVGKVLWIPSVGEQRRVTANTSTTITVSPGFAAAMANGDAWYLVQGMGGTNLFRDCQFVDDQNETFVGAGSLDPTTDISVAGTPFFISSTKLASFVPGQRIKLVGVLSGATDLTVKYLYPDKNNPDMMWVEAVSPTTGTFTTTAGTAIINGSGTVAFTYNNNTSPSSALPLTGTSTYFSQDCDGHYWINPGTNGWKRILNVSSDTAAMISTPWSASFSGQSFKVSKFDMAEVASQNLGYKIAGTPSQFNLQGNQRMSGNSRSTSTTGGYAESYIDYTSAPNATARLTINSATPTLQQYNDYRVVNTSATTITSINYGYEGQIITLRFENSNTSMAFGGGNLRGYGSTVLMTNGAIAIGMKVGTNWNFRYQQP